MTHPGFSYEGDNPSQQTIVADDGDFRKIDLYAPELLKHAYRFDGIVDSCPKAIADTNAIAFRGRSIPRLPAWLRTCTRLRYLGMPSYLAECLSADVLPVGLVTLELTGENNARIDGFVHAGIERIVAPNAVIRFSPSVFPCLKHFHVVSGRNRRMLKELGCACIKLISATISPFASSRDFELPLHPELRFLRLVGGCATSLKGISRFQQLTDLTLHNLPHLGSISELDRLPLFENISIGYCRRIRDAEVLIKIGTLRQLYTYGCGDLFTEKDRTALYKKRLELLSMT